MKLTPVQRVLLEIAYDQFRTARDNYLLVSSALGHPVESLVIRCKEDGSHDATTFAHQPSPEESK
ncbi:MAG: hypothetical protein WC718_00110 [Phycisphaerales bacterium]|jgi:hypothetical protein